MISCHASGGIIVAPVTNNRQLNPSISDIFKRAAICSSKLIIGFPLFMNNANLRGIIISTFTVYAL